MRQLFLTGFMQLMVLIPQLAAACDTGPDYCTDDPRIAELLADKKASLLQEYPANFVELIDIGAQCVARINQSPDAFTLMTVGTDGSTYAAEWTKDSQMAANDQIKDNTLKEYWIFNTRQAFKCAGDPNYADRPDYDKQLDLNTSFAIRCNSPTTCPVQ